METIKAANKILREGIALLPDEAKADYKTQANKDLFVDEAIANAMGAVNDDAEKTALLTAYAVQNANQVVSALWRLELLPDELEKEYRELPTLKEVADAYNEFTAARKERLDKIMADHKVITDEEKELDIFKGIINGISAKDAERIYNEFKAAQTQAAGR